MSDAKYIQLLKKVAKEAAKKPKGERLRTKALGQDPDPIVVFELTDLGTYTLDLTRDAAPFLSEEDNDNPSLRLVTDKATFASIWKRKELFWDAVTDGRMEFEGSTRLGHGLQRYFDENADLG